MKGLTALRLTSLFTVSLVSVSAFAEKKIAYDAKGYPYVKGEMLVQTRSRAALERLLATTQGTMATMADRKALTETKVGTWFKVRMSEELETQSAFTETLASEGVLRVEPNYIYTINIGPIEPPDSPVKPGPDLKPAPTLPNPPVQDPDLAKLYGLTKINVQQAWEITKGSRDVIVADIDTGIDYNHVDLSNNLWRNPNEIEGNGIDDDNNGYVDDIVGYNFRDKNAKPYDDNDHGTHTSGTIAATGGNGVGISGVVQVGSLMGLRFLGGSQGSGTTEDAILCIDYATKNGAQIMSNSWGGGGFSQALYDSIKRADEKGILFVAAAGNSTSDNDKKASYPASYDLPNIVSVAATDENDGLAYFSNYGAKSVHLGAPGVKTLSLVPGDKYDSFSGTSMATPHVAGVAALIKSAFPQATAKDMKEILLTSVDSVSSLQGKTTTGGRLNAMAALEIAKQRFADVTE